MKEGNSFVIVSSEVSLVGPRFSVYADSAAAFGKEDDLDGFEEDPNPEQGGHVLNVE